VGERERRIGFNEAVFREVNERIEQVSESLQVTTDTIEILCECGNDACAERLEVPVGEYERVRKDPTLFLVLPGHEVAGVEDVVEQTEDYDVVRKNGGEAAELARELDPRDN
jgi:hypothetical protein